MRRAVLRLGLLALAMAALGCGTDPPAEPTAASPSGEAASTPPGPKLEHEFFPTAAAALEAVLERTSPRAIGFGEFHQQVKTQEILSALERFSGSLLPVLAGKTSDLVVETWVAAGSCGADEKKVTREVDQVTERPAETENETVRLLKRAQALGIAPHILEVKCEDYARVLGDAGIDYLKLLELVGRRLKEQGAAALGRPENKGRMVALYGGAIHNDARPEKIWESVSFAPTVAEKAGGAYVEVDLFVPEFIRGSKIAEAEPWYPLFLEHASPDKALLIELRKDSFVLIFPEGVKTGAAVPPARPAEAAAPEPREGVEYLLLLGVDRSSSGIGRTDAILIVALDHGTGALGVISVPRDLWVDIPGMEPGRINKVYRWGDRKLGKGKGIPLLARVIKNELGISPSHTAAADFAGFARVVDTLGGIDVDVECPIKDCFHSPVEGKPCIPLSLAAGVRRLDGKTSLLFARSRHGRTDLDRARRQQKVLMGLWGRLKSFEALLKLPTLYSELEDHVTTDLDLTSVVRLARFATGVRLDRLHGLVLRPPIVYSHKTDDGKDVLMLDRAKFRAALGRLFTAPRPGLRGSKVCPKPDVGLRWRERLK